MSPDELMTRAKLVMISDSALVHLITEERPALLCLKGVPKNAIIRGIHPDNATRTIGVVICHQSFEIVKQGDKLPVIDIQFTTV